MLIATVFLEISFRIYNKIVGKSLSDGYVVDDDKYGWVHNIEYRERPVKNKCGEDVVMKTPEHKLIIKFPKYNDAETTVLFIGDSYTHAHEVSTGKAYYDVFEKLGQGQYRVFTAAVGGFGTAQEFMMLNDVYEEISPDYIVWQMCSNDIENNVYELDNASFFNNQRPRPYYDIESDKIFMKNPGFWLFDLSHGFRFVFPKIVAVDYKYRLGILDFMNSFITLDDKKVARYRKMGVEIAETLIGKAINIYSKSTFIGFSVNVPYDAAFQEMFIRNNAHYWHGFAKFMATHDNYNCYPLDAHWNHYGNIVAGEKIFKLFEEFRKNEKKDSSDKLD